jgi:hypothetical protein
MNHSSLSAGAAHGEVPGRRAKDRSEAIARLRASSGHGVAWGTVGCFAAGAVTGWALAFGANAPVAVSAAACAALALAAVAVRECVLLRRREQAILQLLLDDRAR